MNPADELRTAAEKIRTLSKAISAPDERDQVFHAEGTDVTQGRTGLYDVATTQTTELADYIAAMHPGVGTALAAWLESWTGIEMYEAHALPEDARHALAVARQINGTAT
ncbi:hypothetical protein ACFW5U_27850 [Streptomyces rochei]|uniref:hypothetical protein n=1 Tax=Streptomyces rochei TaxID=1928 RepID=UPI002ACE1949|nr:hypothetical protein [Streptomyces rochei]WQC12603.1 hypothetical protein TR631_12575 [Streptomyces rochei]